MKFTIGDVVALKSRSPKMTVVQVIGGPASFDLKVVWVDYNSGLVKKLTAPAEAFVFSQEAGVNRGRDSRRSFDEVYEGHNEAPGY